MPSAVTHELIATETKRRLNAALRSDLDFAPDYYYLGAQGGDLLFFYRPFSKKEQNMGKFFHRKRVYALFCAFRKILNSFEGDDLKKARAYCLGYISHYSTDVAFHPFVYRYLALDPDKNFLHQEIENDWDVYFARTMSDKEAQNYEFSFSLKRIRKEGVLYRLLSAVAKETGRKPLKKAAFRRALNLFGLYLKHVHKNCYKRHRTLQKLPLCKTFSRLYPKETPDPNLIRGEIFEQCADGATSADELFERAVTDGERRIRLFSEGSPLPREEFNRHLLTGDFAEE